MEKEKKKEAKRESFTPMRLVNLSHGHEPSVKITATTTIKGEAAEEFDQLAVNYGLNRSQLLLQMVYHCLNRTEDLKEFYRRLALLGR